MPRDSVTPSERANRRLRRLRLLFVHLVLTIILALGLTYLSNLEPFSLSIFGGEVHIPGAADSVIPVVVLLFVAHALWFVYREARNFIVRDEMPRQETVLQEKPKREQHFVLDDDGELVEVPVEDEAHEKQTRAE
jgi:hypothetical protein